MARQGWSDTRWHLKVTPLAEHLIPVAGRKVKSAMLGDIEIQEAVLSVRELTETCRKVASSPPSDSSACSQLQGMCSKVCSEIVEHVQRVKSDWTKHLHDVHTQVRRIEQSVRADVEETQAVRSKYRNMDKEAVDVEFRKEVRKAKETLESRLSKVRDETPPDASRTTLLCQSCDLLKEAFSTSYGSMPTPQIIANRKMFEQELNAACLEIVVQFANDVTHMLETS